MSSEGEPRPPGYLETVVLRDGSVEPRLRAALRPGQALPPEDGPDHPGHQSGHRDDGNDPHNVYSRVGNVILFTIGFFVDRLRIAGLAVRLLIVGCVRLSRLGDDKVPHFFFWWQI